MRCSLSLLLGLLLAAATGCQTPVVSATGDTMRIRSASVTGSGPFGVTLVVENDNANASLPTSFRRWWHCQIANLNPLGVTLNVVVDSTSGYSDVILPVWALSTDGVNFGSYTRCPTSATPTVLSGGRHSFSLQVPPGTVALRLAKYFPYTVARKNAWIASLQGRPQLRSTTVLGTSVQGRSIEMLEFTDSFVPDTDKRRVWIHSGIHPSESTSYFTIEGLVEWLCSNDPYALLLLDRAIVTIVPMANPDGVFLGNYRVNANSVNLENEWSAPYTSSQPEIVALRTQIETFMGTVAAPAPNPIEVLLNLHATHNVAYPFHFRHTSNASWTPGSSGVLPVVHQIETQWIDAFRARSPLVALGVTQASSLTSRPFVESMVHDRWTAVDGWLNAPGLQAPVMAITFEGTYGRGPDQVTWNTEADYRLCGQHLGLSLCDFFGLVPGGFVQSYGSRCQNLVLTGTLTPTSGLGQTLNLTTLGSAANALVVLAVGGQQLSVPLPAPWQDCNALASLDSNFVVFANLFGVANLSLPFPPSPGLLGYLQAGSLDAFGALDTSNGLVVGNNF